MKSFTNIFKDFANIKIYLKLYSRTPSKDPKRLHITISNALIVKQMVTSFYFGHFVNKR